MAFLNFIKVKLLGGHERSVKAKKNIILLFLIKGYSIAINLALIPLTLSFLGEYKYGIWITLFTFLSMIQISDIGIGNGLRNKFSEAIAKNDFFTAQQYVSTGYIIMSVITLILIVLFIIPWLFIDWSYFFNVEDSLAGDITFLVGITFILTAIQFSLKLITTLLTASHKPALSSAIFAISNTFILLLFIGFKSNINDNIVAIGIIYSVAPLVILLVSSIIFFNSKLKNVRPKLSMFDKEKVKDLFNLGIHFFVIQIAVLVIFQTDSLIISHTLSPIEVTPYSIAYTYFGIIPMFASIIMTPFWSAFTDAHAKDDFIWINSIIIKQIKLLVPASIIIVIMLLLANSLIPIWLGKEIHLSWTLLIGMAIFSIISIWNNIFSFFLNGISKTKTQVITSIVGLLLNIPLSIYLALNIGTGGVII
ncbi:oligosaccharide flippase family protein, partial [Flavobacteriaceae bacterium]|nr:oligosaccharide flippase family protein [Flavobacteriaceae bacterium]